MQVRTSTARRTRGGRTCFRDHCRILLDAFDLGQKEVVDGVEQNGLCGEVRGCEDGVHDDETGGLDHQSRVASEQEACRTNISRKWSDVSAAYLRVAGSKLTQGLQGGPTEIRSNGSLVEKGHEVEDVLGHEVL